MAEDSAVGNFREYLRINTSHPNPDYASAAQFLKRQAEEIGLTYTETQMAPEIPMIVMTWEGREPTLPSIFLCSHVDVVPVFPEHWKYEPFSAHKDDDGNIFARGSQDMKCVGIMYLEAVRRLKKEGKTFLRTIHLCFSPEEEVGGLKGMKDFCKMEEFRRLNVGLALDESIASPSDAIELFYGERSIIRAEFTCGGDPGHASRFIENTAVAKLHNLMTSYLEFRAKEENKLKENPKLNLGDVTSSNLTIIKGGVQLNVVPSEMSACFDFRVTPHNDIKEFEAMLQDWSDKAGSDVTFSIIDRTDCLTVSSVAESDPWWKAFDGVCKEMGLNVHPQIAGCNTDSRHLRNVGISAFGFSPINYTPVLLHDHNEFLNEKIFLRGIDIYYKILPAIASVPHFTC